MKRSMAGLAMGVAVMVLAVAVPLAGAESPTYGGQEGNSDLAQELSNPLANLVTIPIQANFDRDLGPMDRGEKVQVNIQPVLPFSPTDDWNLISRTIIPVIYQDDVLPGEGSQSGLGDINVSLFFSPVEPTSGGLIWGVGPALLLPTASDSLLGARKWGAGPAAVVLTTRGPWTMGLLGNHVWSYAGVSKRQDISNTLLQPFVAYTTETAWTYSLQAESVYNWKAEQCAVPVNASVAKLVRWGPLPVSLQAGAGYWVESPASGPEGWRFRVQANFVLPKFW